MQSNHNDMTHKKKERKSFYFAACAATLCLLAVGAVYYKTAENSGAGTEQLADAGNGGQNVEQNTNGAAITQNAGNTAIEEKAVGDDDNTLEGEAQPSKEESEAASVVVTPKPKKDDTEKSDKAGNNSDEKTAESVETSVNVGSTFNEEKGLVWPVKGEVIMKFSETNNVYFKTLAQYRSNPAIEIQASEGARVTAAAAGTVTDVSKDEETGTTVTMKISDDYKLVYGQLDKVKVTKGDEVKEGQQIGQIAAPTKYFVEEGSNLYFQVLQNDKAVDPLLLLK